MGGGTSERRRLGAGLLVLLRFLPTVSPGLTVLLVASVVAAGLVPVAFTIASGVLVGAVPAALGRGFDSPDGRFLLTSAVVVGVLYLAQQAAGIVQDIIGGVLGRRLSGTLQTRVMGTTLAPPGIAHLEDPAWLDKISLARNVVPGGFEPAGAVMGLAGSVSRRLTVIGSLIVVGTFSKLLAAAIFVAWLATQAVLARQLFALTKGSTDRQTDMRRSVYFRDLALTPPAAKEIRLFGLSDWLVQKYVDSWTSALKMATQELREGRRGMAVALLLRSAAMFAGMGLVAVAAARGSIDLQSLAILLGAVQGALLTQISYGEMQAAYGAAAVPALLSLEKELTAGDQHGQAEPSVATMPASTVRFENVSFAYPGSDQPVFSDFDLELRAGERIAVVGVNGAGKTTLVKLLCGLYPPDTGRVVIDGVPLTDIEPEAWCRQVAVLFQDFVHYELSVVDNIAFGVAEPADLDRVHRAARRAGAEGIVEALPDGWDTVLSAGLSRGTDLSGGQWQKVALARALFAVDQGAQLLVLDEPTANLDVKAEAEIYDRFLELTSQAEPGRGPLTTMVISHRFSTVRRADRIVVLEHGRVVEDGSHDDLLAFDGRYADMFRAQAGRFVDADTPAAIEPVEEHHA